MPLTKVNGQMLDGAITADSSGNVGIGTSSPANKLSLATTANGGFCLNVASRPHFGATYSSDSLVLGYSVKPNPSTVDGMVGTETNSGGGAPAAILMNSGVIQFHTATSVTSGAAFSSERMRITSGGDLLVGTTSTYNSSYRMSLAPASGTGGIVFKNASTSPHYPYTFLNSSGTTVGYIEAANTATTYVTTSDYRLKENIEPMRGALNKVAQLKPVIYTWKTDGSASQGFIAHELQAVVPECVTGEKDAVNEDGSIKPQGVDTSFLVATLTAAIQELKAELDATKAEVAELKARGQ